MTHGFSHELPSRRYVDTAHADRAEAIARFGFLVIAGADRGLRRSIEVVTSAVASLAEQMNDYRTRRATYQALSKLDDRLLRDIGLTRADVELGAGELPAAFEEAAPASATRPATANYELKRAA